MWNMPEHQEKPHLPWTSACTRTVGGDRCKLTYLDSEIVIAMPRYLPCQDQGTELEIYLDVVEILEDESFVKE
jgi:hypothetical protein